MKQALSLYVKREFRQKQSRTVTEDCLVHGFGNGIRFNYRMPSFAQDLSRVSDGNE